uniref:DNA-directed RNA polymerase subunit beta'' n=1 Tax=Atractomorpha echinata TaxID=52677 RepID=A0A140GIQ2_9CHLO|nr:RNA polymerase beta subunit [Atractomorpha echinata]
MFSINNQSYHTFLQSSNFTFPEIGKKLPINFFLYQKQKKSKMFISYNTLYSALFANKCFQPFNTGSCNLNCDWQCAYYNKIKLTRSYKFSYIYSLNNLSNNYTISSYFQTRQRKNFSIFDNISQMSIDQVSAKPNFWNLSFDKGRIKTLVSWFLKNYGQKKTIQLVENLKNIGFEYATKAGISLGIDDLKISPNKAILVAEAEKQTYEVITQYKRAQITGVERFQRLIDTWHRTSENLKQEVINYFEITDLLNPVYMMAFSGARGNISQVRQLVGMRGLMADPKGQILDFPIRSNFREGLTLTEYLISSYGARKGIVDTALRTANAGYLTRRLVDVAQHVIVCHYDCGTNKGILISDMKESSKIIYSLQNRLIGRVLAQDIYSSNGLIAVRNQEISSELAGKISKVASKVLIRSALTCETHKLICQLCYGWSLGQGKLVSIGDAVGVIAAQSIGEPGTQLTMRTFHTGGVFSSDVNDQIMGPYDGTIQYFSSIPGTLVRTPQGKIAFLTKAEGSFVIKSKITSQDDYKTKFFKIPSYTLLFCRHNEEIYFKQVVAQICSSSTQNKQRDDAEQSIQTELQGQVYMDRLTLIEQTNDYGDTNQQSWDWGYIWILSGKIYEIPVDSYIFPKFGDFVNQNSILNQIQWVVPDKFELNLTVKKSFSDNFNNKLPNKKNKTLLYNFKLKKSSLGIFTEISPDAYHNNHLQHSLNIAPKVFETPNEQQQTMLISLKTIENFKNFQKLPKNALPFQILKEKFHNILSVKNKFKRSAIFRQQVTSNFRGESDEALNTFNFLSENLHVPIFINKKHFSFSTDLNFKKSLLLFDTNKFIYKKLGYFFKVNLPSIVGNNQPIFIHFNSLYTKANFINKNDKFFIPVNLHLQHKLFRTNLFSNVDSKLLSSRLKLENSFDWKNFPHTLLTWFPAFYEKQGSCFISYEINQNSPFNVNTLNDPENLILKQKNPSVYSQIIKNISQFPLKNLNYNQMTYNKFKNTHITSNLIYYNFACSYRQEKNNFSVSQIRNSKKLWFFSEKEEKEVFKNPSVTRKIDYTKILQRSNLKKYAELKWKNSNAFSNKHLFYRGRIFWIPHYIYKFLALENAIEPLCLIEKKQFKYHSFNWQAKNSILYYNFTRQGKKVPVSSNIDGLVQIYKTSIFKNLKKTNTWSSSGVDRFRLADKAHTYSYLGGGSNKKLLQSIKNYNKKYYVALKFKSNKMNLNKNFLNIIISMNPKKYKKLVFLKSSYVNKSCSVHNYKFIQNRFLIDDNEALLNCLKMKNAKNREVVSSIFKFSFFNFNQNFEKQFIINKLKPQLTNLILQIQSGWIYIPSQLTNNLLKYNKSIIPLGKVLFDDVIFDNQLIYLEYFPIKSAFLKYNLNFLNLFASVNFGDSLFFRKNTIYQLIKQKHKSRIKSISDICICLSSKKSLKFNLSEFSNVNNNFLNSLAFSLNNLIWVSNFKLRHFSNKSNILFLDKKYLINLPVKNSLGCNIDFFSLESSNIKEQNHFFVIIKKVHEYNIQEMSYYKNNLYNSQITNLNTNFSFLLKQNYHTAGFNKQVKNLRLISKFPNVDLHIEPNLKAFSTTMNAKQYSSSSTKLLKFNSITALGSKALFYTKSSNLLYFKLHFINNSTFQMYSKKPIFSFNYLISPHFFTIFSSYFNFMYTHILNNLTPNFEENHIIKVSPFFCNDKKLTFDLSKFTLFFSSSLSKLFSTPSFNFSLSQKPSYFFNKRFFVKTRLTQLFSASAMENGGLSLSSTKSSFHSLLNSFPTVQNSYILKNQDKLLEKEPFAYSSFLSPYEGEFLVKNQTNWNTTFQKNRLLILTKRDLISFNLKNLVLFAKLSEQNKTENDLVSINKHILVHHDIFIKFSKQVYKIDNLLVTEPKPNNVFLIGEFIYYGDQINQNIAISQAGQVIHLNRNKLTIRKGQSIFLSSKAILHACNGDLIDKNFPVVTLPYQKLKAGDIVQGIPKIEQFFEARITRRGRLFRDSIPNLLKGLFKRYKLKYSQVKAVRQSFYKIQQILVDGVQRVYRSQGVTIADKHIEIIVKQMTCKVKIINGGQTGFFPGELVDLEFVEQINKILMNKVYYEPVVLGITKASLEVGSFLSAASFQQTTRMLSKAAISRKKDFLKGLKENVIVGNLIPSGTGYLVYLQDSYQSFKI